MRLIKRLREIEKALGWLGVMMFTGHIPERPIPELIQKALDEYKRQRPDERLL